MNHAAKRAGGRKRRGLRCGFFLAGLWALALGLLLALSALREPEAQLTVGIRLNYRGQVRRVDGAGLTAGELLQRLKLELTEQDTLIPAVDAVLSDGAEVTVTRRQQRQETFTLVLPAGTEYRLDDTLAWGQEAELTAGTAGELRCVAQVNYVNGQEVSREIVTRELLCPSQPRIVAVGTRETDAPVAEGGCLWLPGGQLLTYSRALTVEATAFTSSDPGCPPGAHRGIAVVSGGQIPEGARLYIAACDGSFTYGFAQTVSGNVAAGNRIDLYLDAAEAAQFGRKQCVAYFLG